MSDPRQQAMALLDQAAALSAIPENMGEFFRLCNDATTIVDVAGQVGFSDVYSREQVILMRWNRSMALTRAVSSVEPLRLDLLAAAQRCMESVR